MSSISVLKDKALATLKGKWASFVGLTFIYMLISSLAGVGTNYGSRLFGSSFSNLGVVLTGAGIIATIILIPMQYGYVIAHLRSSRQDLPAEVGDLFIGFKQFWKVLGAMLLMTLIVFIGCIFFIIPGVILALAYALVPFLLYDEPELSIADTLKKSREMMNGHKGTLFLLYLSFIGWMLLGILTFFIGYLWLMPYMQMTEYKFYEEIKAMREQDAEVVDNSSDVEMAY